MTTPAPASLSAEELDDLERIALRATPAAWHAHNHSDMARVGGNPEDWVGYAWVGYATTESTPDGRFEGKIACLDARKDGSKNWREGRQHDAAHIAAFDPPTVLRLIASARAQQSAPERLAAQMGATWVPNGIEIGTVQQSAPVVGSLEPAEARLAAAGGE
jgi:hypothetical protein